MQLSGDMIASVVDLCKSWPSPRLAKPPKPYVKTIALVLDFHYVLFKAGLQKSINRLVAQFAAELSWIFKEPIRLSNAWRASGIRLGNVLRRL